MRFIWVLAGLAVILAAFTIGCGGGGSGSTTTPGFKGGGIGEGPPMPAGEQSPMTLGPEAAQKMGRGPGSGGMPEQMKQQMEKEMKERGLNAPPGGAVPGGPGGP